MQAVILCGGEGTRLRPLTATVPKPSVPLVNRPMIAYMIDWLARYEIRDLVMSCGFLADGLRAAIGDGAAYGVRIRYVEESRPLGTAGAVKHAEELLENRFLVMNGDVLADFDLAAEIAQHERTGARATIALTPVEDASAYGLVQARGDGRVEAFIEKPDAATAPTRPRISAGAYVLERNVLDLIPVAQECSFEHDVFPLLIRDGGLYAFDTEGYWLDVGTPARYLTATYDLLERRLPSAIAEDQDDNGSAIAPGSDVAAATVVAPVVIDDACAVGPSGRVGPLTVLGHGCKVGASSILDRSVLQRGCAIGDDVFIERSIIGPGVQIGDGVRIYPGTVIGEGARIGSENVVPPGSRIAAGVDIPRDTMLG